MNTDYDLTSLVGVVALTAFIVSQTKVWMASTPGIKHVPIILVSLVISVILTLLAYQAGYQSGPLGTLLAKALLTALGSAGLYDIKTGSSLQSLQETAVHPTTKGNNSLLMGEVKLVEEDYETGYTPPRTMLFLLPLLMLVGGCANTQLGRVAQVKESYTVLLNTISDYRDLGYISQAEIDKTKEARRAARIALDEWERLARGGVDTSTVESKFQEALKVIQRLVDRIPSTQPSTYEWIERIIPNAPSDDSGDHRRSSPVGGYAPA